MVDVNDVDYTVKVDVKQLEPATVYYYQFSVAKGAVKTAVGRTKTLPAEDAAVDKIAIASVSCAYYAYGEFTAYGKIAEKYEDLDIVLHLGDYIYEYGNVNGADGTESALFSKVLLAQQSRAPVGKSMLPPTTCVSLEDYRQRYALYHTDVNLVELHRVLPWIVVPDDHEVVDNGYEDGAAAHDPATQGPYQLRVNAGLRAWHEWVPNRQFRAPAAYQRFYRAFQFGTLAELIMLDTRYDGRDKQAPQPTSADDFVDYAKITATNKIMGDVQMAWITDKLATSTAQWKVIGNQVPFTDTVDIKTVAANPLTIALINTDSWAGYKASQQQLLAAMENVQDVIILTGDIHTPFAMQVFQKANGQPYAAEYVTTSITSPGIGEFAQDGLGIGPAIQNIIVDAVLASPNVVNLELFCHGYHITTYTATEVTAQYYCMDDIHDPTNAAERESWKYVTCSGTNTVVEAADAAC
ncbi:PhoD-like phosphatase-domain-containing protein [Tribonema minus]|uniref:PhoD-like phosphatase-domain-containing protein n=1 Tax=Tribonema minus TaxID=303371 RepID=A0A836C801_9STRA|nr:PhoD-like phosphatase-domain-containing protein [Tribonema minus]